MPYLHVVIIGVVVGTGFGVIGVVVGTGFGAGTSLEKTSIKNDVYKYNVVYKGVSWAVVFK